MANSSILGAQRTPTQAAGRDTDALGPSDSSDSGSDVQNELHLGSQPADDEIQAAPNERFPGDTDSSGTGERNSALPDERIRDAADISPDRIEPFSSEDDVLDGDDLAVDIDDEAELPEDR